MQRGSPQVGFKRVTPATTGRVSGDDKRGPTQTHQPQIVGACRQVDILVKGKKVTFLLDTGSNVTLMTEACFKRLFAGHELNDESDLYWLKLRAANGLSIPYVGYVMADVQVGDIALKDMGIVISETDPNDPSSLPILGMNIIGPCWDVLFAQPPAQIQTWPPEADVATRRVWAAAFDDCQRIRAACPPPQKGTLRPAYRHPVTVPRNSELVIWARTPPSIKKNQCVLIEPLESSSTVNAARSIGTAKRGRVPVKVRNLNPFPVTLQRYQPIATFSTEAVQVREPEELTFEETSPGVMEVGVRKVSQEVETEFLTAETLIHQNEDLPLDEQDRLKDLLTRWGDVFAAHEEDFGRTGVIKHPIPTGMAPPIRERYRPIPPSLYQKVRELLNGMIQTGVVRESTSPWAAPIVLVRKKNGTLRFCVDYRKLNAVTHKDAHPLPRIEETLTTLTKASYYSTLDLASGYWQIEVAEDDREKTAFCTPFGLYEFERMPFGLCNAPATFQRLMQRCLGSLITESALVYLDDVIVYSPDFDTHVRHLEAVFERLRSYGLKLRPDKCVLFQKQVKFLGHIVSSDGVAPDPEKIASVQSWPVPQTTSQVRSFLGFTGYYRRYIGEFARIARPLNSLLIGVPKNKKQNTALKWDEHCQQSFDLLKQRLLEAPILAFADFSLPFRLYTDASNVGLGAVLAQMQDGKERVIAYASRSLSQTERNDMNYSSFKLELLALKWAVTEKFKDYLWGSQLTVYTDNNPLVHLSTAKLGAIEQRWAAQLANYNFELKYRPGKDNVNADVLSRMPPQVQPTPRSTSTPQQAEVRSIQVGWDPEHWRQKQQGDLTLRRLAEYVIRGTRPTKEERRQESAAVLRLMQQWPRLQHLEGVLIRRVLDAATHEVYNQILIPLQERRPTWEAFHEKNGHLGVAKTLSVLRRSVYWPQMEKDLLAWTATCERCIRRKGRLDGKAPLVPFNAHAPLQTVAMDFLTLSRPADSYQHILVATDVFTKYAWAMPTRDQTASTTARQLLKHVIQPMGCPEQLHSDQAANFESALLKELCQYYNCRKTRTTAYHPQGNGTCERFNQTLLNMLGTLEEEQQSRWVQYLPELMQAYNNSVHASTGYTPHYLMFGWNARLPVEVSMGTARIKQSNTTDEWVQKHHERLSRAFRMADENTQKSGTRAKERYDATARATPLLPGERVLVHTTRRHDHGKLAPHWEDQIQVVVGQPDPEIPTYQIRPEGKDGPIRIVHRNRLRVCTFSSSVTRPTDDDLPREDIVTATQQWLMLWSHTSNNHPMPNQPVPAEDEEGPRRSRRENFGKRPERFVH